MVVHFEKFFRTFRRLLPVALKKAVRQTALDLRRPFRLKARQVIKSRLETQSNGPVTLFFTPEAGVTPHLRMQAHLARCLKELGEPVLFVRCFDYFPRCPVKDMLGLPYAPSRSAELDACLYCADSSDAILGKYELDFVDIREIMDLQGVAEREREFSTFVGKPIDFVYKQIEVGRLAFYDFAIAQKHPVDAELDQRATSILLRYIVAAMAAIDLYDELVRRFQIKAVICFDVYAMLSAVRLRAAAHGIDSRLIRPAYHFNADYTRPICTRSMAMVEEQQLLLKAWEDWKSLPLPVATVRSIGDDLIFRMVGQGIHVYSPNLQGSSRDVEKMLNLDRRRKTIVAFTSSRDEHDAMLASLPALGVSVPQANDAFSDMFEWLEALIDFVETSDQFQLVIRLHPRLGSTPRDGVTSSDYPKAKALLDKPTHWCRVIWPQQDISSYDVAALADVATISWSSMGLELARMGVPVVSGYQSFLSIGPGNGFIWHEKTKQSYFARLRKLADRSLTLNLDDFRAAYRWYNLIYLGNSLDFSDSGLTSAVLPEFRSPQKISQLRDVMMGEKVAHAINLTNLSSIQYFREADLIELEEYDALSEQRRRIVRLFAWGNSVSNDIKILPKYTTPKSPGEISVIDGSLLRIVNSSELKEIWSPLLVRLISTMQSNP